MAELLTELLDLFGELGQGAVGRGPVEADRGRLLLHPIGGGESRQRRQPSRHHRAAIAAGSRRLLILLQLLPLAGRAGGADAAAVGEHVRMAADHLLDMIEKQLIDGEAPRIAPDLGAEEEQEDEIPELFAEAAGVVALDRVDDLVSFLEDVRGEGAERLLAIPRATAGAAQPADEAEEGGEGRGLLGGDRRQGRKRRRGPDGWRRGRRGRGWGNGSRSGLMLHGGGR